MQRNFASCRQSWTPFANVVPRLSPPKQSQNFFFVFLKYNTKAKISRLDTVDAKVFCVPNVKDLITFFLWYVNFAGNSYKWLLFPQTSSNEGGTNILLEVLSLRNTSIKFRFPLWCYKMLAPQNYTHKLMLCWTFTPSKRGRHTWLVELLRTRERSVTNQNATGDITKAWLPELIFEVHIVKREASKGRTFPTSWNSADGQKKGWVNTANQSVS